MISQSSIQTTLLFDGFCPACDLKDTKVVMQLNSNDFFECQCGLQIATFSPCAVILGWKGKGEFKEHEQFASQFYTGLVYTKANSEKGQEIFPDPKQILHSYFDLEEYIESLSDTLEDFDKEQFNPADPIFEKQAAHLDQIETEKLRDLVGMYTIVRLEGLAFESFPILQQMLYELGIIFSFPWNRWKEGQILLQDSATDYSKLTMLQISMLLTLIFRSNRFDDVSIIQCYENKILDRLFDRLEELT